MWNIIRLGIFCTLFIALISCPDNLKQSARVKDLHLPNLDILVDVLENGLIRNFMHVNVRLVDCPDLSQEPFNLAAPGLCGQPVFIEIGDETFLEPVSINRSSFFFTDIIEFLNRDHRNSFIFGNGASANRNGRLNQMIVNASFSPTANGLLEIENKSHIISTQFVPPQCYFKKLSNSRFNCSRMGTFFLCDGLTGPVLEVRAKAYRYFEDIRPSGFIDSMRNALIRNFGPKNLFVVLGGVYVVDNALWKHELVHHPWECYGDTYKSLSNHYCHVNVPETIISTFHSSSTGYLSNSGHPSIKLTCQSTHSLSHHSGNGDYSFNKSKEDDIEYIGYFSPAEMVYRFDEPNTEFPNLQ